MLCARALPTQIMEASSSATVLTSKPTGWRAGSRPPSGRNPKLGSSPEIFICHRFRREEAAGEVLLDTCTAEKCGTKPGGSEQPARKERRSPDDTSCYRYPAEDGPRTPQCGECK